MKTIRYKTGPTVPVDALRLAEDISSLSLAIKLLKSIDKYNVAADPDTDVLWLCIQKLKMCERFAQAKLRYEYLDPRRKKV